MWNRGIQLWHFLNLKSIFKWLHVVATPSDEKFSRNRDISVMKASSLNVSRPRNAFRLRIEVTTAVCVDRQLLLISSSREEYVHGVTYHYRKINYEAFPKREQFEERTLVFP